LLKTVLRHTVLLLQLPCLLYCKTFLLIKILLVPRHALLLLTYALLLILL